MVQISKSETDKTERSLTEQLVSLVHRPVDSDTRRLAAWHVMDWLGCAIGGHRSDIASLIVNLARETAVGPIHAIGAEKRSLDVALLLNTALGSILELDDAHRRAIMHPGAIVIPAALAAAEITKASPVGFLDAVTRGYEVSLRIGMALGREHYKYWHNSVTAGVFGAAAATGNLCGLDDKAMVWALGNAGSTTGGLWQMHNEPVMTKYWQYGQASLNGLRTALLASRGFTGPRFILEGPQGLFAATAPGADGSLITKPEPHWLLREVSFKPWAASRHVHPAIDAALYFFRTLPSTDIRPKNIAGITVATYHEALDFCDIPQPRNIREAKFSLQHGVAVALTRGTLRLEDFEAAAVHAPATAALRARVDISEDPTHSARFPDHFGATITLRLKDGRELTHSVEDAKGDPEHPASLNELVEKSRQLMVWSGLLDRPQADRLIETTLYLPECSGLQNFFKLLP